MQLTTRGITVVAAIVLASSLAAPAAAAAQDAEQAKRGEQVYAAQKCQVCHAIAGKGGKASPLDHVATKLSPVEIRQWITDPAAMTKKTNSTKKPAMPAKWGTLPAADVDALVAYMMTLK
jgi:mono/diheme cytochrome c family protein